jgi:hypothetical protein
MEEAAFMPAWLDDVEAIVGIVLLLFFLVN